MIYFGGTTSSKQLMLKSVAKYQALDEQGNVTDRTFYIVVLQGSSFMNVISETVYEVLKTIMEEYNGQLAVLDDGSAKPEYKGRTNQDVKKVQQFANKLLRTKLKEDGILGPKTQNAVKILQKKAKMQQDGYPDYQLLLKISLELVIHLNQYNSHY